MFELTNEQRKCFALPPVLDTWEKIEVKPSPYDKHCTYAYIEDHRVIKEIYVCEKPGEEMYCEYSVDEMLSEDKTKLLPRTDKGKPQNFTSSNLEKRTGIGMAIQFSGGSISVFNFDSEQDFYRSCYEDLKVESLEDFKVWVDDWCKNTGEKELAQIQKFAKKGRVHQKFREGDFFKYRINRNLYGYGRILLDFARIRKEKIKFWDVFMGKPLCIAVYHVVTENANLTPEDLVGKMMLPSQMIMDNIFYYGECEIIGNIPLVESEKDYPIHYGRSIDARNLNCINYQCGNVFVSLSNEKLLYSGFMNNAIGWTLYVKLPILNACIKENSNDPYWRMIETYIANCDLRNPKFEKELMQIKKQMQKEKLV